MTTATDDKTSYTEYVKEDCPICNHRGWCAKAADNSVILCRRKAVGASFEGRDKNGAPYYVHPLTNAGDGESGDDKGKPPPRRHGPLPPAADVETRDMVYRELLDELPLDAHHLEELKIRGLGEAEIDDCGYGTLRGDIAGRRKILQKLAKEFGENVLLTVPGFIRDDHGTLAIAALPGLLIPVRNIEGQIIALKIKPDRKLGGGGKYLWVSSGRHGGPSPGSPCHVPNVYSDKPEIIRLTEGELKADIATRRGRMLCLSSPGVSNWRAALPTIEKLGCRTVRVAFDSDASVKAVVALATVDCCRELAKCSLTVEVERWAWSDGKGIDDILVAGKPTKVLTGGAVTEFVRGLANAHAFPEKDPDEPEPWAPLRLGELPPVPDFPLDVFPPDVADFVTEAAGAVGCDPGLVAGPVLATAGGLIGRSASLLLGSNWFAHAGIFQATVAQPGDGKTPAQYYATAPVRDIAGELADGFAAEKTTYHEARRDYERSRRKKDGGSDGAEPDPPTPRRVCVDDTTFEALARVLAANPRGLLLVRDELSALILGLNQYKGGGGADRPNLIRMWSTKPVTIDRVQNEFGEPIRILHPFLCITGNLPPGMLREMVNRRGDDGLLDRWLFIYPDRRPKLKSAQRRPVGNEAARRWRDFARKLWDRPMDAGNGGVCPHVIYFSNAGKAEF
jgi:hypothetical protein